MRESVKAWGWTTLLVMVIAAAFSGCGDGGGDTAEPTKQPEPEAKPAEQAEPAEAAPEAAKPEEAASEAKPADDAKEEAESAEKDDEGIDLGGDDDFDAFDYSAGGGSRSGKAQ